MLRRIIYGFTQKALEKVTQETVGRVGVIYLNSKPDLNSLSAGMKAEIIESVHKYERDPKIRTICLLSKVEKAFCAGANIKQFENKTSNDFVGNDIFESIHHTLDNAAKPIVCGVNGVALGGGAQLALLTDVLVCSEDARFGLPEVKLGLIPGIGGTQRFARSAGKYNAMRYILTGDLIPAQKALEFGLVSDVFKKEQLHQKTLALATQISQKSLKTLIAAKSAVKQSAELSLSQGIRYERSIFYPLYDTKGAKQGIKAFIQKRNANFQDE